MLKYISMWKLEDRAESADKSADARRIVVLQKEVLDDYQDDPTYVAINPFIGAVRFERQCIDYEIRERSAQRMRRPWH